MKWTSDAEAHLRQQFEEQLRAAPEGDVDLPEVEADIRHHVEEEHAARGATAVTAESLRRTLAQMGGVQFPVAEGGVPAGGEDSDGHPGRRMGGVARESGGSGGEAGGPPPKKPKRAPGEIRYLPVFWIFAVIIPLVTLGIEVISGFCAGVFFDPVPSWWHVLLVALVPVANGLLAFTVKRRGHPPVLFKAACFLNGAALVIAAYYTLLYIPLMPMAVPTLLVFGMGVLPMASLFGLAGALVVRKRVVELFHDWGGRRALVVSGFAAATVALLCLELPKVFGRVGLLMATAEEAETRERGIALLRSVRPDGVLMHACYESSRRLRTGTDTVGWIFSLARRVDPSTARKIYYRVTGRSFNTGRPPRAARFARGGDWLIEDFSWDEDQGGDEVAARVADLDLIGSRLDGHIDPVAALGYLEWTLVFQNSGQTEREARFQALLPPLGVVSRLTLWVDGEEREAAFAARSQVKEAYKNIVQQRKDPVLVTTAGPDRVLVQCYPVPARGGEMKIRIGITAPLDATVPAGRLWLPQLVERNFSVPRGLEHSVWVQSVTGLDSPLGSTLDDAEDTGAVQLRALVDHEAFQSAEAFVDAPSAGEGLDTVWADDPFAADERTVIVRRRRSEEAVPVDELVVVVDSSINLSASWSALCDAIGEVAGNISSTRIIVAGDSVRDLGVGAPAVAALREIEPRGGVDNAMALVAALTSVPARDASAVVWLHGSQPEKISDGSAIDQYFERSLRPVPLYAVQVAPGPNRVLEDLYRHSAVRSGVRLAETGRDLGVFFERLTGGGARTVYDWEHVERGDRVEAAAGTGALGEKNRVSDQLARYWAYSVTMDAFHSRGVGPGESGRAARYQLVTPFSGAVVLETAEQFSAAGLEAVDATSAPSIPIIPEPSTAFFIMLSVIASSFRRRRPWK